MRAMATHGDHPELPAEVEAMLEENVSTLFLKAGCIPRTKRGKIGEIVLIDVEDASEWQNLKSVIYYNPLDYSR